MKPFGKEGEEMGLNIKKRVRFSFRAPDAGKVFLAGDFNSWSPTASPMKRDKKGLWVKQITLPKGSYQYKFVVDDKWVHDPEKPAIENTYGTFNNIIEV